MARVLVVSDSGDDGWGQNLAPESWKAVKWCTFSAHMLEHKGTSLLVAIAAPARLSQTDIVEWKKLNPRCKILAVLSPESSRDDIDVALSVVDDLVLSSERRDLCELRALRLLNTCCSEAIDAYEGLIKELGPTNLVGQDPTFLQAANRMLASARTDFPVLILGETGTGKELFARAIHFMSHRRNYPFVPVECGGIPDHLFENELFGHVRGAFTDAHKEQRGLASVAEGGTLFLDEVDSLSLDAQSKLLRFLQERQFKPLGAERWTQANVRIIAASNRDLVKHIADRQFRQDLYFRLDVLRLEVPPLRERPHDIPMLARHFLWQYQTEGTRKSFSPAALRRLASHHWPGNVRELLNVVQRAIVFSHGAEIDGPDITFANQARTLERQQNFRTARQQSFGEPSKADLAG
jgi:DNA-binding NtrC family response regulator